jgi:hypothetical protein
VAIWFGLSGSPVPPLYLAYAGKLKEKIVINKVIAPETRELVKATFYPPAPMLIVHGIRVANGFISVDAEIYHSTS